MSNSSTNLPREHISRLREMVADEQQLPTGVRLVAAPLRFVGFWAAVALPFLYVPLLFGGLQANELTVFVTLIALNALALVLGHNYARA